MTRSVWIILLGISMAVSLGACVSRGRLTPYDLGVALHDQGKFVAALEHYQEALAKNPEHMRARFNRAVIYHDQGNYEAAKREYRRLLQHYSDHTRTLINLADIAEATGDATEAHVLLRRAVDTSPHQAYPYSYLGRYLQQHGRREEARAAYERALAIEANALTHYRLGTLLLQQGDEAAARDQFVQALRLEPYDSKSLRKLARLALEAGDDTEAERYLRRLSHLAPHDAEVFQRLGKLYLRRGRYSSAVLHLWEARDLHPSAEVEQLLLQVYEKLLHQQREVITEPRERPEPPPSSMAQDAPKTP